MHSKVIEIRREAALLLGSLCSLMKGRELTDNTTYEGFRNMLFDVNINGR